MKLSCTLLFLLVTSTTFLLAGTSPCSPTLAIFQSSYETYDAASNSFSGVSSDICLDESNPDFWIQFTMTSNSSLYLLMQSEITGQANIAIYEDDCTNPIQVLCYTGGSCINPLPQLEISGLHEGSVYYLKIWSDSSLSTFDLYLNSELPDYEILPNIDFYCAADIGGLTDACFTFQAEGGGSALAWLPEMVDFNMSLNHRAEIKFDAPFSNPTEQGMTMVYSNYAPTSCFDAGLSEDIFTTNLTESFIIELNVEESNNHFCRISVNGATGLNLIAGPTTINNGNIQDGFFHNLDFKWYPNIEEYEVYFDEVLIFTGSYDIINNCLGGNNLTNRGYTGMMPSSNNQCCSYEGPAELAVITTEPVSICEGESITIGGVLYEDSGLAVNEYTDNFGCPAFSYFVISTNETSDTSLGEIVICVETPFIFGGVPYSSTGSYQVVLSNQEGCDSIIDFSILNISPTAIIDGNSEINCINEMVELNSQNSIIIAEASTTYLWESNGELLSDQPMILVSEGIYILTITSELNGISCSQSTSFEVLFVPDFTPIINTPGDTICSGDCIDISLASTTENYTYQWSNDSTSMEISVCPDTSTTYSVTVTDDNNCEQTASTIINVYSISTFDLLDEQLCIGDTFDLSFYSDFEINLSNDSLAIIIENDLICLLPGDVELNLTDINGCLQPSTDLFITIISCDPDCSSTDTTIVATLCQGESIAGYTSSGIYVDTFPIGNMCDSIVVLDLTISPAYTDSVLVDLCFGDHYNGIDTTTMIWDSLLTIYGCDSLIFTTIIVQPPIERYALIEICEGEDYMGHTDNGTYTDTLTSANGCDSILSIELEVLPTITDSLNVTICEGDTFEGLSTTGIYIDTFINTNGCFMFNYLELEVLSEEMINIDTVICQMDTLFGTVILAEGTYTFEDTNEYGCEVEIITEVTFGDCTVSSKDIDYELNVNIFPNPTYDYLNIVSNEAIKYELFDFKGSFISTSTIKQGGQRIDFSTLVEGIYFLKISSSKKQEVVRIFKID